MRPRCASWILCTITLASGQPGWSQPVDTDKTLKESNASAAYEDRLIDAGNLSPLLTDAEETSYNPAGWPRTWRIETFVSTFDQGGAIRHENGLTLSGRLDTPDYGALSLDSTLRSSPNSSIFTLSQRRMPFDNGWWANNGVGILNTLGIELSRHQYRFYVPTFPMAGAASEWLHDGNFQFQASVGEPGLYNGLRVSGFSRLGGNLFASGAEWAISPHWLAGLQVINVHGVRSGLDASAPDARTSVWSGYGSAAWQSADTRAQANVLDSEANQHGHHRGLWLDGETRRGRYRFNYGLFRLEPEMFWGYAPIASDLQGGYYRINYQSQQWLWDAGLDSVHSVSGRSVAGLFATGSIRYQINHSMGVGGGTTVRHADDAATAAYAFVDKQTRLGTTRVQLDIASAQSPGDSQQLSVDQAWAMQVGVRLSTAVSLGQESDVGGRVARSAFSIFGGADLSNNLSLEGNLRLTSRRNGVNSTGTYANIGLNWHINSRWSLSTTYYDNRSEDQAFLTVAPLIPTQTPVPTPRDRAFFLVLRYEGRAGTPLVTLGGAPGSGAGTVAGYLFYDDNDDGRRHASDRGAANVTVLLDGKFSTRTDTRGRFEFSLVPAGPHTITVLPDNLPLPYAVAGDGRRDFTVRTRETATVDIAVSRLK